MKKLKFYSFASALLLASAAGMSSCSSDVEATGGGTDGARDVVKTQFAINLPYGTGDTSTSTKGSRMSDTNTQQNKNFRGIQDLALLCFEGTPGTKTDDAHDYTSATKVIYLNSGDNAYSKDQYRALYRDIEIPTGTTNFIMNGRANRSSTSKEESATDKFKEGCITPSDDKGAIKDLSQLNYKLNAIAGSANFADNNDAKTIINQLNAVAASTVDYTVEETESSEKKITVNWKDAGNSDVTWPSAITTQQRQFLATRYKQFIALTAGSKASVEYTLQNLQEVLIAEETANDTQQTDGSGENQQASSGATTVSTSKLIQKKIYDNCATALTAIKDMTFPRDLYLPDGVAQVAWNNTSSTFAYVASSNVSISKGNNIDYTKIAYPAELSYTISSPAMVSEKAFNDVRNLPDYSTWINSPTADGTWTSDWSKGAVTTRTQSVALQLPVQYSVAVLKTTAKCASATLKDNRAAIMKQYDSSSAEPDQDIEVPNTGYPLTAILVGGQPSQVEWDFYAGTKESFDYTVYDHDMNGTESTGEKTIAVKYNSDGSTTSTPNYTLLLDNKVSGESAQQKDVYVTLELINQGKSFYGVNGLIPQGSRFYLVGTLSISGKTTDTLTNVFMQDHITTANFTISDLKKAYNCIPDLRTAGLSVGLAVDLTWQTGITFDINIGGE